jgi:hypothetical protein
MQKELNLFAQALSATPSIKFVTLIAFLIPRTPSASILETAHSWLAGGVFNLPKILVTFRFSRKNSAVDATAHPKSSR